MKKYQETKDLEEVAEALLGGLEARDTDGASVFINSNGELSWTRLKDDRIPTLPGRIFLIEVPKPEAPDGWEILPHGERKDGMRFFEDGTWHNVFGTGEQASQYWYARKKLTPKMVRVEFKSDADYILAFELPDGMYSHQEAPSVLGPGGYEYEWCSTLSSSPSMFLFGGKHLLTLAEKEDIESGRAVPVLPVAYWYMKKEG